MDTKIDSSGMKNGLSKLGSFAGTSMKVVGAAVGAATVAVGAFAKSSVNAGMTFDSSMSQVAATMGYTTDELNRAGSEASETMQKLSDFAQQMGSTTAFSASEAADALNYMALAGYDAETSMSMLPNVLNLAAAGGIELAAASDMVTDAQTALGLNLDETSQLVDKMAKAASKSNTSVQQLGDAILTIGGNAKNLSGGTTELAQSLGVLADNGIKGSEAGTHLRNIMLSLTPSTDAAAAAWDALGVSAYDADGNLRPLQDTFQDLSNAMNGMTTEERTNTISAMFNKTDLASVNALLATSADRWDELSASIDDSAGAAEAMAAVQLDNLDGDITLFKSALEGAQIALSDGLTPSLREFVQFGSDGLSRLTTAFKEGGFGAAMDELGVLLSELISKVTDMLPGLISAGASILTAIVNGIVQNLPKLAEAALSIADQLGMELIKSAPQFISVAGDIIKTLLTGLQKNVYKITGVAVMIIKQIAIGFAKSAPELVPIAVDILTSLVDALVQDIGIFAECAIELISGLAEGLLNAIPVLLEHIPYIIWSIAEAIIDNAPLLLDKAGELIVKIGEAIVENIPLIIELLPTIITWIIDALVILFPELISSVVGLIGQIISAVFSTLAGLLSQLGEWLGTMISTVVQFVSQLPEKMAYWAGFAIASMLKFFMELPSKITEFLQNVIAKVIKWGTDLALKAPQIGKKFVNDLVNAVKDLPSKFAEIGSNIVSGIWNGINAGWNWLIDNVKNLAQNLLQGAKDALDIHSPSKKFQWLGEMCVAGFDKGIDGLMDSNAIRANIDAGFGNITAGINTGATAGSMNFTQIVNVNKEVATADEMARAIRLESRYGLMRGVAIG